MSQWSHEQRTPMRVIRIGYLGFAACNYFMEISLAPELEARLAKIASEAGKAANQAVQELVADYIEHDEWFGREVQKGLASLDSGKFVSHEEVGRQNASLGLDDHPVVAGSCGRFRGDCRVYPETESTLGRAGGAVRTYLGSSTGMCRVERKSGVNTMFQDTDVDAVFEFAFKRQAPSDAIKTLSRAG